MAQITVGKMGFATENNYLVKQKHHNYIGLIPKPRSQISSDAIDGFYQDDDTDIVFNLNSPQTVTYGTGEGTSFEAQINITFPKGTSVQWSHTDKTISFLKEDKGAPEWIITATAATAGGRRKLRRTVHKKKHRRRRSTKRN